MTNIDHTTETLPTGTVRHTYNGGPFAMTVFDRRENQNDDFSTVIIRPVGHTYIRVGVMAGMDPGDPDYLFETRLPSRPCDLGILIEDAAIARDVLHDFREILLTNHEITTTLNGGRP